MSDREPNEELRTPDADVAPASESTESPNPDGAVAEPDDRIEPVVLSKREPAADPSESHAADEPGAAGEPGVADPPAEPPPTGFAGYRARRKARKAARRKRKAPWWELPALVGLAVVIAILVKTFVIQPFYIPSPSMENTLHGSDAKGHDRILVFKPIYGVIRDPEPGDIVVFHLPKLWDSTEGITSPPGNPVVRVVRGFGQLIGFVPPDGQVLVKRVIAVGGQTVKGDSAGHVMISTHGVDGPYRTLDEPYVLDDPGVTQDAFGPVTVPKGRLWVMGDHRTSSADSRYHCRANDEEDQKELGGTCSATASTVPVDDVIGKAIVVAWPPSHWRTLGTPTTFESASAAAAPVLPSLAGTAVAVPLFLVRRRRRR